jgi:hypothetical protein
MKQKSGIDKGEDRSNQLVREETVGWNRKE